MIITKSEIQNCIHERFEKVSQKYPNNLAIVGQGYCFTYTELDRRANAMAHLILQSPVGKQGDPVAILMKKSPLVIVAMLATLKIGRIYTCIDPGFPVSRMKFMLADSEATIMVVDQEMESYSESLITHDKLRAITIPVNESSIIDKPQIEVSPNQIAYFIYTSGSTGKPKGVMQNHRNVLHYTRNYTNGIKLKPQDRLSLLGSFAFGAATMDVFAGLLIGASLFTLEMKECSLKMLSGFLIREKISIYHSVPSVLRGLMNYIDSEGLQFPDMRLIDLGGELVRKEDVIQFKRLFPKSCVLVNGYGCTELNVICQYHVTMNVAPPCNPIPVGQPVDDIEILLLDENGLLVKKGDTGEVVIRSPYSSLGYWKLHALTSDRFQIDPEDSQNRLFYTKDRGYLLPGNQLVLKGRNDDMHKIRGFRVEISEVEHTLAFHELVKDAAVKIDYTSSGNKRLIGYYVLQKDSKLSPIEFRGDLLKNIPEFMVPSILVPLTKLPRTETGKVDKKALPPPNPIVAQEYKDDTSEHLLASIWSNLLNCSVSGHEDHFFHLGGDSLSVMFLINEVNKAYGIDWEVKFVYDHPRFSEQIKNLSGIKPINNLTASKSHNGPFKISLAMERFTNRAIPNANRAFRINGKLNIDNLQKAWNSIQKRHPIIRTPISKADNDSFFFFAAPLPISPIAVLNLPHQRDKKLIATIQEVIQKEFQWMFQPEKEYMSRTMLYRVHKTEHILIFQFHHLVFDGYSWDVFFEELSHIYQLNYEPSNPNFYYADLCIWESSLEGLKRRENSEQYWQNLLGQSSAISIPHWQYDINEESKAVYRNKPISISNKDFESLSNFIADQGLSYQIVLLTSFNILLFLYTKVPNLVIDFPVSGRNRKWMTSLIGCFVRDIAIRTQFSIDLTLKECLEKVKYAVWQGYEHQEVSLWDLEVDGKTFNFPFSFRFRDKEKTFLLPDLKVEEIKLKNNSISKQMKPELEGVFGFHALIFNTVLDDNKININLISRQNPPNEADLDKLIFFLKDLIIMISKNTDLRLSEIADFPILK